MSGLNKGRKASPANRTLTYLDKIKISKGEKNLSKNKPISTYKPNQLTIFGDSRANPKDRKLKDKNKSNTLNLIEQEMQIQNEKVKKQENNGAQKKNKVFPRSSSQNLLVSKTPVTSSRRFSVMEEKNPNKKNVHKQTKKKVFNVFVPNNFKKGKKKKVRLGSMLKKKVTYSSRPNLIRSPSESKSRRATSRKPIEVEIEEGAHELKELYLNFIRVHTNTRASPMAPPLPSPKSAYSARLKPNRFPRSVKSSHSRASLDSSRSKRNKFIHTPISDIKRFHKLQMLMSFSTLQVKKYFGCISSSRLSCFQNLRAETTSDFLRSKAIKLDYSRELMDDLDIRLQESGVLKCIDDYSDRDRLAFDERTRQARIAMDNFDIDSQLFSEFFQWRVTASEIMRM